MVGLNRRFAPMYKELINQDIHLMTSKIYKNNKKEIKEFNDWDRILYRRGFEPIIDEFISAVKENREPSISLEDALETHRLCEEILDRINKDN
ncbi:hypothetical protein [Caproiciproducens sp. MSJ-32]|uniref:hypothetical protein n=1 Tax=Caproiciproducens sp. MSJ-32 TaxID=2841527 RepID=UPI00256FB545|nr:hypothetical protein [Caproiciproducens sp. MSJ-32]